MLVCSGLGTVGNFAAQLAGLQGGTVIGLDLSRGRAERARACGIPHALVGDGASAADRVREITGGEGLSTLIEATGIPSALPPALPLVGRYGEAILLGTPRGVHEADLTSSILDYIHLHGHGSITFKGAHEWRYPVARDPLRQAFDGAQFRDRDGSDRFRRAQGRSAAYAYAFAGGGAARLRGLNGRLKTSMSALSLIGRMCSLSNQGA